MAKGRIYRKSWEGERRGEPLDIKEQERQNERNRCATRRFEAHFVEIANRWGATVFDYRREEKQDGQEKPI